MEKNTGAEALFRSKKNRTHMFPFMNFTCSSENNMKNRNVIIIRYQPVDLIIFFSCLLLLIIVHVKFVKSFLSFPLNQRNTQKRVHQCYGQCSIFVLCVHVHQRQSTNLHHPQMRLNTKTIITFWNISPTDGKLFGKIQQMKFIRKHKQKHIVHLHCVGSF